VHVFSQKAIICILHCIFNKIKQIRNLVFSIENKYYCTLDMKKTLTLLFCIPTIGAIWAQNAYIKGTVSDAKNKETIVGANVVVDNNSGTATDINGDYFYKIPVGDHKTEFRYLGYKTVTKNYSAKDNDTIQMNIMLEAEDSKTLDVVVVSAGKFEQKLSDVTVSMEVIKPSLAENKAVSSIDKVIDQVPGVNIIDGQANIRGGSGFSYGAGSRVLVTVDEMPMLTAHQGDVKWTFLPIENLEQVEVIKGASSALFGSSAINGVINFRTAYAKDVPETKVILSSAMYDQPKRKELASWWKNGNPTYSGVNFYHAQKFGNLDFVLGGNVYHDDGFRQFEFEQRFRINTNLRYRFKKIEGLSVGVNINTQDSKGGLFTLWQNPDSALTPAGAVPSYYVARRTNIDPFIVYNGKHARHSIKSRYFRTDDASGNASQGSNSELYYNEYQYQRRFGNGLTWTAGGVCNYSEVHSNGIYGTHYSTNLAAFSQFDKKFDKLTLSLGIRGEYYKTDSIETREDLYLLMDPSKPIAKASKVKPVLRAGANYHIKEFTFLRASFGQGFRFPTIAERYIRTSASGLDIYPNDSLRPETGWSAEFAVKQGFRIGGFKGFLDVAAFWSEYRNMMEFTIGQYGPLNPPLYGVGFQSQNIGNTRIRGFEVSVMGTGKIGVINFTTLIGYTYIDPRQTDFNIAVDSGKNTLNSNLLKYRYQHSGKLDIQGDYKQWSLGVSMRANSYMANIDKIFGDNEASFPGMKAYRLAHNKGDAIFDCRISHQLNKTSKIAFVVNNLLNREVMPRPALLSPQRSFVLQLTFKI
jgi:outer membrane receptor protein involved in Fe transport